MAEENKTGFPCCWKGPASAAEVVAGCDEYDAVTGYVLETLGRNGGVAVQSLTRLQNRAVYKRCAPDGGKTIMFHGCRSHANEENIIQNGFQVSRCVSGGSNFGTWFAYGAAYSDSGYVYTDQSGVRHLFVCVVSYKHTVYDNQLMRVVGQDCAYPLWLLKYTVTPAQRSVLRTAGGKKRKRGVPGPQVFFVAKDGQWVPVNV
jgi:hypothetical protein